jgi:SAM-dependent methyltransferase
MARAVHAQIDTTVECTLSRNPQYAEKGYISGETLLKSMGFEQMHNLDCSSFEGADIIFDLNCKDVPQYLEKRFDVIINHGTMEHVFHVPNVLNNCFQMLKVGGRMIHGSPTSNLVDHGFYMFSPTLFYDYYTANNWEINNIYVISMTPNHETEPSFYTEYEPGSFDRVSRGGLNGSMYATMCFVTKTIESTANQIPQQGLYSRMPGWQQVVK